MVKTVAALFDKRTEGLGAVQELVDHEFARGDISIMTHDDAPREGSTLTDRSRSGGAQGTRIDAALGGVGGLVVGLASLTTPGIGPVIVAGPLATPLRGADDGAAAGDVIDALTEMGIPEQHAHYYAEGVRRGGVLVTVVTTDAMADRAVSILSYHNPVDLSKRAEEWRKSGWTRFEPQSEGYRVPAAPRGAEMGRGAERVRTAEVSVDTRAGAAGASPSSPMTSTAAAPPDQTDRSTTMAIPVVEEEVQVGKRAVERDVRVHTTVTEKPVEEQIYLREEHVTVERRPADRPVSAADRAAFREGVIEITETVEEPVVAKQARVVEEVVVHKEATDHVETIRDTVRRTDVEVEQEQAHQESSLRSTLLKEGSEMPRGDKSKDIDNQKRQAEHIEEGYEKRGVSEEEVERRAGATVNKMTGGGKKSGSGRAHTINTAPAQQSGHKGGAASAKRSSAARSASAKKAAQTRKRRAATAQSG